ncbi:MAG: hypothetical protein JRG91_00655 [Deltaproteobacteria bacterium]|nr:hypothetical protein [Deltaproteobacteria bacterium]
MAITRMRVLVALGLAFSAGCGGKGGTTGDADADVITTDPVQDQIVEADAEPDPTEDPDADPAPDPLTDSTEDPSDDPAPDPAPDPEEDPVTDPVDDPTDPAPDPSVEPSCTARGCPASSMGLACCTGLTLHTGCEPGVTCPTTYCVDCGDGVCRSHETAWDCSSDCPAGCTPGTVETTVCPGTGTLQCTCVEDPCKPYCDLDGTAPDGWIDACSGLSIATCSDTTMTPRCLYIGTRSEGWYEPPGSGGSPVLIDWDFCAPRWSCVVI